WSFKGSDLREGMMAMCENTAFYSQLVSSAQRLPNGNTLITEGSFARIFEVTPEKEIVWEFKNPFEHGYEGVGGPAMMYRTYRYPYEYVPQLEKPVEVPVERVDNMTFRMPGAADCKLQNITEVPEAKGYGSKIAACVTEEMPEDDEEETGAKF
ncbi:MAG: thioredoxin, partial [Peptococcaceae bacterium]|nr:thioredoxin [Peptococcaceae bacterium]